MSSERLKAALADRYRIERELGQGGMATVYLAEDLKHDRKVALKVLRPELAAVLGAERFVQEIKTTAALQHPHILPLFDSGEADGFLFYVMPYIEGETLRDRLNRETQLGVDEAVRLTGEVADALDYAHRHGVIHRDIKPENILLHDGRPMVADFGIALALSAAAGGRMTETGMSLGTPHYMSPEQATADKEITGRSDVYSLGSVLYEMLTGDPPHTGSSAQQIIMKIVTEEAAPVTKIRKSVPPHVAAAISKAIEKVPADRFESARAFAEALGNPAFTTPTMATAGASTGPRVHASRLTYTLGALALVMAALAAWALWRPMPVTGTSRQRIVLWEVSPGRLLDPGLAGRQGNPAAIAPDGSSIVFSQQTTAGFRLMRKMRDAVLPVPVPGGEGGMSPFFSPDGRWIGFRTFEGQLKKVPVEGGGAVTLTDDANGLFAAGMWLDDETIVYLSNSGVRSIPTAGGASRLLVPAGDHTALTLSPLPDARGVLYTECSGNCSVASDVLVYDFRTDSSRLVLSAAVGAWYAPTGHLLFTERAGGLMAVPFDLRNLEATGGRVPVIPDVLPGMFSMSAGGTILYSVPGGSGAATELVWVTRDGRTTPVDSTWEGDFVYPAIAPDGRTIAVSRRDATTQLWIRRADGTRDQLTQEGTVNWRPAWTADGAAVIYSSRRGDADSGFHYEIYRKVIDHSAPPERLVRHAYSAWEGEITPDGGWLVFRVDVGGGGVSRMLARRLDSPDTTVVSLVDGPGGGYYNLSLSPDGRWLAFAGDATGREEVYVAPFPDMTFTRLVSQGGGLSPRWSRNGRELFFRSAGQLVAVPVTPGPTFVTGAQQPLFPVAGYRTAANRPQYDVTPDGQRFLMVRERVAGADQTVYVEHWFAELRDRLRQ